MDDDPLEHLLKTTGWSPDDLLQRLQKYKAKANATASESTSKCKSTEVTNAHTDVTKNDIKNSNESHLNNETDSKKVNITLEPSTSEENISSADDTIGTETKKKEKENTAEEECRKEEVNSSQLKKNCIVPNNDELNSTDIISNELNEINELLQDVKDSPVIIVVEEEENYDEANKNINMGENVTDKSNVDELAEIVTKELSKNEEINEISKCKTECCTSNENKKDPKHKKEIVLVTKETENNQITVGDLTQIAIKEILIKTETLNENKEFTKESPLNVGKILENRPISAVEKPESEKINEVDNSSTNILPFNKTDSNKIDNEVDKDKNTQKCSLIQQQIADEDSIFKKPKMTTTKRKLKEHNDERLEDIRNNLKMQLNSLRTKKRGNFLRDFPSTLIQEKETTDKKTSFENDDIGKKIQENNLVSEKAKPLEKKMSDKSTIEEKTTEVGEKEDLFVSKEKEHENLYTQTDNFGFVISDIKSGIELEEEVNENDNNDNFIKEFREIITKQRVNRSFAEENCSLSKNINDFEIFKNHKTDEPNNDITEKKDSSSNDNSQSSFLLDLDESSENTEKISPFVSNTLDEFLTINSKLNISYKVPKLGAEETLKDNSLDDNFEEDAQLIVKKMVPVKDDLEETEEKQVMVVIKPKTLAQKRKLLEKQKLHEMGTACKLDTENVKNQTNKNGHVFYRGKKLYVKTYSGISEKCVAKIEMMKKKKVKEMCKTETYPENAKRKLSLLAEDKKNDEVQTKYLAGPLCKKPKLQVEGKNLWETEVKKLPKLFVDVIPAIGKPIHPDVLKLLPQYNGVLNDNQITFALSVLNDKRATQTSEKIFRFPLKYQNNKQKILTRKLKLDPGVPPSVPVENRNDLTDNKNSPDVIKEIIDDLLRYVELKEIEETLIKEDETYIREEDSATPQVASINDNVSAVVKKSKKGKSKVDLELSRLSCKIVKVQVEQEDSGQCNKPYCRLGCVCKSLKCDNIIRYHCQKATCMFECKCPKERTVVYDHTMKLPAGTDILSTDAVTKIEDEAKRNLARVEREFTQTVIHTNDKTIVLGLGTRSKARKAANFYSRLENSPTLDNFAPTLLKEQFNSNNCVISLEKINLADIQPFCLVHHLYNCHCKFKAIWSHDEIKIQNQLTQHPISKKVTSVSNKSKPAVTVKDVASSEDENSNGRPNRNIKKPEKFSEYTDYCNSLKMRKCARAVPLSRSKMKQMGKNKKSLKNNSPQLSQKEVEIIEAKISSRGEISDAEQLKMYLTEEKKQQQRERKRKQTIEVRDGDDDIAVYIDTVNPKRKKLSPTRRDINEIKPVFDDEIIINESNLELLKKMGPKTVADGYARLLPWKSLMRDYQTDRVSIWCCKDPPSRVLMNLTNSGKKPPPNYVDIKKINDPSMVVRWICNKKLPSTYNENNVMLILKEHKEHFEICGFCTRNITIEITEEASPIKNSSTTDSQNTFKYKDIEGSTRFMELNLNRFKLQELIQKGLELYGDTSVDKTKLYMWASIPEVHRVCKWRVIFLNNSFSFLNFKLFNCTIRYNDLVKAAILAKRQRHTVMLRNAQMKDNYNHKEFGIYFEPHYHDRFFVGPYFIDLGDKNDLQKIFIDKNMKKKISTDCGYWLVERPYWKKNPNDICQTITLKSISGGIKITNENTEMVIDLTSDDKDEGNNAGASESAKTTQILIHNGDKIQVIDAPPRKPEDFNRYAITNIPSFGYLGAFQHPNSDTIDIQWPFENKLLRLTSEAAAITFLEERFSSLLVTVPASFKLSVMILPEIDLDVNKPVDTSFLSGQFVCGEFGIFSMVNLPEETCTNVIKIPKEEILQIFVSKAKNIVKERAEYLASILNIEPSKRDLEDHNYTNIIHAAVTEIQKQQFLAMNNLDTKNLLLNEKRIYVKKLCNLLGELPPEKKIEENKKFMKALKKRNSSAEPIEIPDSDDEIKPENSPEDKLSKSSNPARNNIQMRSVLKSRLVSTEFVEHKNGSTSLLVSQEESLNSVTVRSLSSGNFLKGVKLIKNSAGKLILVTDNSGDNTNSKSKWSAGTKVMIKNNKIQSVYLDIPEMQDKNAAKIEKQAETSSDRQAKLETLVDDDVS